MIEISPVLAEAPAPFSVNLAEGSVEFSGSMGLFIDTALAFGVDLQEQERDDWLMMGRAVHIIDQYIDEEKTDIMPHVAAMLAGNSIVGIPDAFQDQCREYMERQSELRRADIIKKLGMVGTLVNQQASTASVHELLRIRRQEADLMANLLALPTFNRPDETQRKTFNSWLVSISHTGYLVDSFKDIKKDYASKSCSVEPSTYTRVILGGAATKQALDTLEKTPKKVIGKMIKVGMKNQILGKKPDFTNPEQLI